MNLVMIGRFRTATDAKKTKQLIDKLTEELRDKIDISDKPYSEEVSKILMETNCYILSLSELESFQSEQTVNLEGDKIIFRIDEMEASAFCKLMVDQGAKVEVFSAHHHPELNGSSEMIGQFKNADDAEKAEQLIDKLTEELKDKIIIGSSGERYSNEVVRVLRETDCYILSPSELEHFLYGDSITRWKNNKIILRTDETEVSAFFKLMIQNGAKVEVFSAHHYPDQEDSGHE